MDILIKQLKNQPRTLEGGFWHKLIYQHQMWLDGLYMASPFMAQYGAEFNKPEWIDEAVKQFRLCHKHTYDAKTGLYHHAWDESKSQRWANPETGTFSQASGGAGIGWVVYGAGRCLGLLYPKIIRDVRHDWLYPRIGGDIAEISG